MTHFEPAPGLDAIIARRFLLPAVDRVKDQVRDAGRRNAPAAKVWVTAGDERVRPTHEHADGQIIPANLRYLLDRPAPATGEELGRVPGDPNLSPANRFGCRCDSLAVPLAVKRSIHASHTRVEGARVRAQVYTDFNRVVESEFPGGDDAGGGWLRQAVAEVAGTDADVRYGA